MFVTLHTLDVPESSTTDRDRTGGPSTLEVDLLGRIGGANEPERELRRFLRIALEGASGVSLSDDVACTSSLAAPFNLDLALLAAPDRMPLLAAQVRWVALRTDSDLRALNRTVREAAFTSIDLKLAHGPVQPMTGLKAWCHEMRPKYFSFWCIQVQDDDLFHRARALLNSLYGYCNAVGVLFVREGLEKRAAPEISLGFALREMALEMSTTALPQTSVPRRNP